MWFLSPKKGSQHLRSLALGIPPRRLGAEPTGRDSIRKKNGGGLGWGGGPSQEGGRGTFSVHVPPTAISSTLGVKSDPGKGNLFPEALPGDSGQREGGNLGEGEGTSSFPSSSRVMSQQKG